MKDITQENIDSKLEKFQTILNEKLYEIHPMISKTYAQEMVKIRYALDQYLDDKFSEFKTEIKDSLIGHQHDLIQKFTEEISRVHYESERMAKAVEEKLKKIKFSQYEKLVRKASRIMMQKEINDIRRFSKKMKNFSKNVNNFGYTIQKDVQGIKFGND